jgi:hypothetical protein
VDLGRLSCDALREREEYEASGTSLPFFDWLNETYFLPKLRMPAL